MNALTQLRTAFNAHKAPILALAAGVVVVVGLAARRNKTLSNVSGSTNGATSTTTGNAAVPASYDSTGTDVYNAFEGLLQQVDAMSAQTPVPAATTAATADPYAGQYIEAAGGRNIFHVNNNGTLDWISTMSELDALGGGKPPAVTQVAKDDPLWKSSTIVGDKPPAGSR